MPAATFNAEDHRWMARALALARRGLNACDPNPKVGCVIVKAQTVIGEGWHQRAGEAHAEVWALRAAGAAASGATAYVSLEPCCHQGRTPPCTQALIEAGVSRVVAAMRDPNPRVGGKGLAELARAGIAVACGCLEAQAAAINPGFVARLTRGRPFLRSKLAASLDGATAMASGESRWITGEAARLDVQRLRARASAILTGVGTVVADDPSLTVRLDPGAPAPWRQPLRVIVDSGLRLPDGARLLGLPGETLVFTTAETERAATLRAAGVEVESLPRGRGGVALAAVLERLAALEVNEVLVEAGPTLNGMLLAQGLVDELVLYLAPHVMGADTRRLFQLPGLARMEQRIALRLLEVRQVGQDLRVTVRPR